MQRLNGPNRLNGAATVMGIAETVEDYQLTFDVWSTGNGCAASDIVRAPGHKVWGVLYEIPDNRIDRGTCPPGERSLDMIEGDAYCRKSILVRTSDGNTVSAVTYVVRQPTNGLRTNLAYVRHIVLGLRDRGVGESYIDEVKDIASANNPEIADAVRLL